MKKTWVDDYVKKIFEADGDKKKIRQIIRDVYDCGYYDGTDSSYDNVCVPSFDYNDMD